MKKLRLALDSSCMIAAVSSWHEHHEAAVSEIERRLDRGDRLVVAAPALLEAFAVLTRLPAPHRLSPSDAWTLLKRNFAEGADLVSLDGPAHCRLIERLVAAEIGGGQAYDGVIAACAEQARADALLTFNRRHFEPLVERVTVVEPAAKD